MKIALITGITGQDGSYLAELLLEKGYEVHGLVRRASTMNRQRIDHIKERLKLHYGDLADAQGLTRLVTAICPHEVYNLGGQSHVAVSFQVPDYTADVVGMGTLRMLEAIRQARLDCRFYQAGSSEMFGEVTSSPQNEETVFNPRSPYACAKVFAHNITKNYREAYGMFACSGILFNHESPRRGENFVTKKITRAVAEISLGMRNNLALGNLDASRDWGHAKDYVEGMWRMLQQDKPNDYVLATGKKHQVREFLDAAFRHVGIENWEKYITIDHRYFRPAEVVELCGDASKAKEELGWYPTVMFEELVSEMVDYDLKELTQNARKEA